MIKWHLSIRMSGRSFMKFTDICEPIIKIHIRCNLIRGRGMCVLGLVSIINARFEMTDQHQRVVFIN